MNDVLLFVLAFLLGAITVWFLEEGFPPSRYPSGISPDMSLINPDTSSGITSNTRPDMTRSTGRGHNRRMQSAPLIPDASEATANSPCYMPCDY